MKKLTLVAALSVSAIALSAGQSFADYTLNILHINDLHSRIEAINAYDSTCSAEDEEAGECFGGIARVASAIDEQRGAIEAEEGNVIVLDAGDQFQGSLFYTTYKGEAAAEFMNMIGFDAMAVGNHEFDDGPSVLADFIDAVEFPVISGNTVVAEAEEGLHGKIEEWTILEEGGERIGILSVLATDTDVTSTPGPNVSFEDEIEYLNDAVARMEAEGVNKIILLSHVGFVRDQEIAAAVDGIDVIVGGHSHTLFSNTEEGAEAYPTVVANPSGTDVPIVHAYAYSKYLGDLQVTFDDEGNVISAEGDTILLDNSVEPDAEIAARVDELAAPIEDLMSEPVGETTAEIDGSRESCRAEECTMGNLVTDAMLARTAEQGVQIAIQNGGGLRASIDAGEITMGEVIAVLPFQNTLATFELSGADIVASLEQGLSGLEEGAGRFPQVAGLRYTFDPSVPPNEGRVQSVEVEVDGEWQPIDEDATYIVATNNFMRNGGDGYELFATNGQNAYDYGPGLEMVLADYLRENSPYEPVTDGRIQIVSSDDAATAGDEAAPADAAGEDAATTEEPMAGEEGEAAETAPAAADSAPTAPAEEAAPAEGTQDAAEAAPAAETAPADEADPIAPAAEDEAAAPSDTASEDAGPAAETDPIEPMAEEEAEAAEAPAETAPAEAAPAEEAAPADEADPIEPMQEDEAAAPAEEAASGETGGDNSHVVILGDTLWDIAEVYFADGRRWVIIAEANPDIDPDRLEVGQVLIIPLDE